MPIPRCSTIEARVNLGREVSKDFNLVFHTFLLEPISIADREPPAKGMDSEECRRYVIAKPGEGVRSYRSEPGLPRAHFYLCLSAFSRLRPLKYVLSLEHQYHDLTAPGRPVGTRIAPVRQYFTN
jgi:hypothetical protein